MVDKNGTTITTGDWVRTDAGDYFQIAGASPAVHQPNYASTAHVTKQMPPPGWTPPTGAQDEENLVWGT